MKFSSFRFQFSVLVLTASAFTACDAVTHSEGLAIAESALSDDVIVDGRIITAENYVTPRPVSAKVVAAPSRDPKNGFIATSGDGEVTVFNDFATEDRGPGVVKDCDAAASDCNISCEVVGDGLCESTTNWVSCTLYFDCGPAICSTTVSQVCDVD